MDRAIIYARVSTAEQASSGLGMAAQVERCKSYCEYRRHEVIDVIEENGTSGTVAPEMREGMGPALAMLRNGAADVLVALKLDRVGRDVRDLLSLVAAADAEGWGLALLDLDLDTTTAAGKLVLTMMAAVAEWESNVIAERTRAALQTKKAQGVRLGRPVEVPPDVAADIARHRAAGLSLTATADLLNADGVPTPRGGRKWFPSGIQRVERSAFLDAEAMAASRQWKHAHG